MITPNIIQQPIAPIVQTQLPIDSLRVDNVQLPKVPEPAKLFPSAAEKEVNAKANQASDSEQSSQNNLGANQQKVEASEQQTSQNNQQNSEKSTNLDAEEQQIVRQLSARDREVRAHERAHASVGGAFAGTPQFTFETGPNGVQYAISGEVSISTSEIAGNPEATLAKLDTVIRAALAPADPSSQDIRVASSAAAAVQRIRASINAEATEAKAAENNEDTEDTNSQEASTADQRLQNLLDSSGALAVEDENPQLIGIA